MREEAIQFTGSMDITNEPHPPAGNREITSGGIFYQPANTRLGVGGLLLWVKEISKFFTKKPTPKKTADNGYMTGRGTRRLFPEFRPWELRFGSLPKYLIFQPPESPFNEQ